MCLLSRPVPIQTIASSAGTTYREIKRLNPVFRSDDIPAGNYEIKLPPGTGKVFEQNFRRGIRFMQGLQVRKARGSRDRIRRILPYRSWPMHRRPNRSG